MVIRKYLHSCLLLEKRGKRLLIDPGAFSFVEGKLKPADLAPVDAIVLTHQHLDHYDPEALKAIVARQPTSIVASEEIGALLDREGLDREVIAAGEVRQVAGFTVRAFEAPHGPIPAAVPHNIAFLVDETLLHPGDSYAVHDVGKFDILALPVAGPWSRLVDGLEFVRRLAPRTVVPIHDAIIKDFMLERIYAMCQATLERQNISFHPLALGQVLEV